MEESSKNAALEIATPGRLYVHNNFQKDFRCPSTKENSKQMCTDPQKKQPKYH